MSMMSIWLFFKLSLFISALLCFGIFIFPVLLNSIICCYACKGHSLMTMSNSFYLDSYFKKAQLASIGSQWIKDVSKSSKCQLTAPNALRNSKSRNVNERIRAGNLQRRNAEMKQICNKKRNEEGKERREYLWTCKGRRKVSRSSACRKRKEVK